MHTHMHMLLHVQTHTHRDEQAHTCNMGTQVNETKSKGDKLSSSLVCLQGTPLLGLPTSGHLQTAGCFTPPTVNGDHIPLDTTRLTATVNAHESPGGACAPAVANPLAEQREQRREKTAYPIIFTDFGDKRKGRDNLSTTPPRSSRSSCCLICCLIKVYFMAIQIYRLLSESQSIIQSPFSFFPDYCCSTPQNLLL